MDIKTQALLALLALKRQSEISYSVKRLLERLLELKAKYPDFEKFIVLIYAEHEGDNYYDVRENFAFDRGRRGFQEFYKGTENLDWPITFLDSIAIDKRFKVLRINECEGLICEKMSAGVLLQYLFDCVECGVVNDVCCGHFGVISAEVSNDFLIIKLQG